jgi:hypothetical protein
VKKSLIVTAVVAMFAVGGAMFSTTAPSLIENAFAQTTSVTPTPGSVTNTPSPTPGSVSVSTSAPDTTVNVGQYLSPLVQAIVAGLGLVITAAAGWAAAAITKMAGLQGTAAGQQIEDGVRRLAHMGFDSAAGWAIMRFGDKLKDVEIDVRNPIIKEAVELAFRYAGDAIAKLGLTPEQVAQKIIEKIGIMTAANPNVAPTVSAPPVSA